MTTASGPATGHRLAFGPGHALLDPATGAPVQFVHPAAPERRYLLPDDVAWHSIEHQWGSGHLITDRGAVRWMRPQRFRTAAGSVEAEFDLGHDLGLKVHRHSTGGSLVERYEVANTGSRPATITGWGVQTPFADLYTDAAGALDRAVHTHLFTGGAWAWALAQPMSGDGPHLGLTLEEGALWGYAVETRNPSTLSNARGHIVLHATDHARNPAAFGGQPRLVLEPGAATALQWRLAWYERPEHFLTATQPPAHFDALTAPVGEPIRIRTGHRVSSSADVAITPTADGVEVRSPRHANVTLDIGTARTEVAFHDPLETVVRRRSRYVLDHQRTTHRPGLLAHAFAPIDTTTLLTQSTNGWSDWSDGSERIGMALVLQQARRRGWLPPAVDDALEHWAAFARAHLMDDTAAPRRGSQDHHTGVRLYDSPWLAQFFLERYHHTKEARHLDLAARLLERALALGGERFLAIQFATTCATVARALTDAGRDHEAQSLRDGVIASARHFAALDRRLPAHEVAYEQAIVAPLVSLFSEAHHLTEDPLFLDAARTRLPWLKAFGGPQPHARLHGVAIRHWDGYWFGQRRQWGDVFPHYWSALTADVLLRLPRQLRTDADAELAHAILRANMSNYAPDGSATCAFIMPTSVDGAPAHAADPLANDQDWHLAIWMRLIDDGCLDN